MLKKIILPVLISTSLALIQSAEASSHGVYIDLNAGTNIVHADSINFGFFETPSATQISGFGWNSNIGYQFSRFFAMEMGFTQYINTNSGAGNGNTIQNADIATKILLPLTNRFNIFGKLGGSLLFASGGPSQGGFYTAVGAAFAIAPQIDLNAQFANTFFPLGSIGLLSVGATYHFAA